MARRQLPSHCATPEGPADPARRNDSRHGLVERRKAIAGPDSGVANRPRSSPRFADTSAMHADHRVRRACVPHGPNLSREPLCPCMADHRGAESPLAMTSIETMRGAAPHKRVPLARRSSRSSPNQHDRAGMEGFAIAAREPLRRASNRHGGAPQLRGMKAASEPSQSARTSAADDVNVLRRSCHDEGRA